MFVEKTTKFSVLSHKQDVRENGTTGSMNLRWDRITKELGVEVTCDQLTGHWRIFQLKRGHRFSNDDLFTAWRASLHAPESTNLLDIGSGVGSVGLSTLAKMNSPKATLIGVEAQDISHRLAKETVAMNGLGDRVQMLAGDLRNPNLFPAGTSFDLITGSPPYFPIESAILSPNSQRAACRVELRGCVYDYCEAARRWLAPKGCFCFVMVATDPRTFDAPGQHGLTILEHWDYVFKTGRNAHICTLVCARDEDALCNGKRRAPLQRGTMLIRGDDNHFTEDHRGFKVHMLRDIHESGDGLAQE